MGLIITGVCETTQFRLSAGNVSSAKASANVALGVAAGVLESFVFWRNVELIAIESGPLRSTRWWGTVETEMVRALRLRCLDPGMGDRGLTWACDSSDREDGPARTVSRRWRKRC